MKLSALQVLLSSVALGRGKAIALDVGAESKEPPKEFRIFGFGQVETTKGTFLFDEESGAQVMASYQDYGNELPFDFEHGMAVDDAKGEPLPACGWFKLELRKDGLWATECRWGKQASAFLSDGAYRYFSPYMEVDPESGRILRLINCALTNTPATKSMTPLVAASRRPTRDLRTAQLATGMSFDQVRDELSRAVSAAFPDAYAWVCDVYDASVVIGVRGRLYQIPYTLDAGRAVLADGAVEVQRTYTPITTPSEGDPQMKTLLAAIAAMTAVPLKETSTEAEALAALNTIPGKLAGAGAEAELQALTGAKSKGEALGTIEAWKQSHTAVAALTAENASLKAEKAALAAAKVSAEVEALVDAAVKEGKVAPAQKELLTAKGKADPEFLKAYLASAPKLVTTSADATKAAKVDETAVVVLSDAERAIAKKMKISEADFAAQKKERADREAARLAAG